MSEVCERALPSELLSLAQWVCWRYEERDGKRTKVPYRPVPGYYRAASDDPETWGTFAQARGQERRFDGIGFVVSPADPYAGIDLDHALGADGAPLPWAAAIVSRLHSYTEITPSGTGLRVWARAKLPASGRRRGNVEMYDAKRFFTLTGQALPGSPEEIAERQAEIEALHAEIFGAEQQHQAAQLPAPAPLALDDQEILSRALRSQSGARIADLLAGDTSAYGGDDSAADQALCNYLAFWFGKDPERIDRVFRSSELYREKWDSRRGGSTYGQITIEKAIRDTADTYTPPALRYQVHAAASEAPSAEDVEAAGEAVIRATLPTIVVNERELRDVTDDVLSALADANEPPSLFVRSGSLARIVTTEDGRPSIEVLTPSSTRYFMSRCANYVRRVPRKKEFLDITVFPPKDVAEQVLSAGGWCFPRLAGIVEAPTVRPEGSLLLDPGYDPETALYYLRDASLESVSVPDQAKRSDVDGALALLDEMVCDFPFVDQASRDNLLGLLLSPILRPAIQGPSMMALVNAPMAGTGKSLLAEIAATIATGKRAAMLSYSGDEEEMRKVITSVLSEGATLITMDNITDIISSSKLAQALTSTTWQDRMMGGNKMVSLPQQAVWVGTGNNLRTGGDIRRRVFWINMDAKTSTPESRTNFKIENLCEWVRINRPRLLSALLTLVRFWYQDNSPHYPVPRVGTFEHWCETVGGVLFHAGRTNFLGNLEEMRTQADEERTEWEAFLWAWLNTIGGGPVTLNNIAAAIKAGGDLAETVPSVLADKIDGKGFTRSLGRHLSNICDVRHGAEGIRVERGSGDAHNKISTWKVAKG